MRKGPFIFWSIFVAAAIFRVSQSLTSVNIDAGHCVKQVINGQGIVEADPEMKESGQILVISAETLRVASSSEICSAGFLIRMKTKSYPRFQYGDRVAFKGRLSKPINFSNKDDPERSFDYEGYLAKSDIFYEIKSAEVSADGNPLIVGAARKLSSALFSLKRGFVASLNRTLGEPHAALASGLVVGEKAALGSDLLDDFRTVGLIHIVVLSGYNITIVGDAMRRMLVFLPRAWGISVGGIGIVLFGVLVGGGATVIRSCFMAGIAMSANIIRRDYDVTRALILAGLIMIIQSPMILLHDPSFQLSFLATMGLILLAGPLETRLQFIPDRFGMRGVVSATLATQIFVSPYILYMMGNLSIVGVIVNILVLPTIPLTMLLVFMTGSIGMISMTVAQVFGWVAHLLLSYELFLVETFARLPFAAVHIPAFSKWWVVGFYGIFFVVYWGRKVSLDIPVKILRKVKYLEVIFVAKRFRSIKDHQPISSPEQLIYVTHVSRETALVIGSASRKVMISRRSIKHILERRGSQADWIFRNLPHAIAEPTKIVDNSKKKQYSFVLARNGERIIGVVIEKTKTPDCCQVVSAFPIDRKTYRKLVDISGRVEFPPFELPSL